MTVLEMQGLVGEDQEAGFDESAKSCSSCDSNSCHLNIDTDDLDVSAEELTWFFDR